MNKVVGLPLTNVYTFVGFALFVTFIVRTTLRQLALRRFSKLHECQSPVRDGSAYRLGISKMRELVRQFRNQTFLSYFTGQFRKHGNTFVSKVVGMDVIFTCDPQNVKQVLHKRFDDYEYGPLRSHLFAPLTPKGLLRFDGHLWKPGRKLFRTDFKDSRAITDMENLEDKTQKMMERLNRGGGSADFQDLFTRLMTDILSTFAVGKSLGSLDQDQRPEDKAVAEALETAKDSIAKFGMAGPLAWLYDRVPFKQATRTIHQYVEPIVKNAFDGRSNADWKQSTTSGTFVERGVPTTDDTVYLRDQTINVFLAGVDTGANLLSSIFFLLSRDQRVFRKLRHAVFEAVGNDIPTYEQANNIPYLRCVINEAMRLYPGISFNGKLAMVDTWLPRGGGPKGDAPMLVKKGQIIVWFSWASHRNPEIFGEDVEAFRPERWETLPADVPGFIPFQPGTRVCPGQKMGLTMGSYVTIRMLQKYSQIESLDSRDWKEQIGLVMLNDNGVWVKLEA